MSHNARAEKPICARGKCSRLREIARDFRTRAGFFDEETWRKSHPPGPHAHSAPAAPARNRPPPPRACEARASEAPGLRAAQAPGLDGGADRGPRKSDKSMSECPRPGRNAAPVWVGGWVLGLPRSGGPSLSPCAPLGPLAVRAPSMLPRVGLRVDSEIHDWLFRSRVAAAVGARPGCRRSNEALLLVRRARPPGVTLTCMTLYDVMTDWSAWTSGCFDWKWKICRVCSDPSNGLELFFSCAVRCSASEKSVSPCKTYNCLPGLGFICGPLFQSCMAL